MYAEAVGGSFARCHARPLDRVRVEPTLATGWRERVSRRIRCRSVTPRRGIGLIPKQVSSFTMTLTYLTTTQPGSCPLSGAPIKSLGASGVFVWWWNYRDRRPVTRITRCGEVDPDARVARRSRRHGRWLRCHEEDRGQRIPDRRSDSERECPAHDHGRRHNDYSERKGGHKDQVQGMAGPRRQGPAYGERGKRRWRNSLAERGPAEIAPDAVESLGERIADGCLHVLRVA